MTLAIRLDAVGGIAGDMFAAAMVDALPDLRARVLADATAVLPRGTGTPVFTPGTSAGLHCLRFGLSAAAGDHHRHDHHHHDHSHHAHAGFRDMVARLAAAPLSPGTAAHATAILRHLAEAEAAIHHMPVDEVHFHEIGDWDSLMDVTAAGSVAAALEGARWNVSALPRGDGLVRTRHGLLPVPAPATAWLLEGFTWRDDGIGGERVTPTGAAILRHLVDAASARVAGRLQAIGTGAGTRELPGQPNILRATLFATAAEASSEDGPGEEDIVVLSFEIDDMSAEEIAVAADRLRAAAGVRDLVLVPAIGKKGRPVHTFRLLVEPTARDAVADACFTETATIGLRWQAARRAVLPRASAAAGAVRVKTAKRPQGPSHKAESDDLAHIAGLDARRAAKRKAEEP
ncbi:MAG: LarC family nickel insertion protein [Reyranella sp.]|uniref:LarC family nickel insertion protein n=1 Tax=Reyranella sp. TaxID=1929291 RepID=UPI003D13AE66